VYPPGTPVFWFLLLEKEMDKLKQVFEGRTWWMNAVMLFCAFMTFIYMPFDMFYKPVAQDQEVWFGFMLTGWAAKATEPVHWLIYGFGLNGFYRMRPWMWPWASLYVAQVAIGMFAWSVMSDKGLGVMVGGLVATPFFALAVALFMAKDRFRAVLNEEADSEQANL
jgi:hypothetical protein